MTVHPVHGAPVPATLDRQAWHRPLVSIIITHHNYSAYLEDALLSVADQTHAHWECVVIDDGSDTTHRERATEIVHRFKMTMPGNWALRALSANAGQIPAFYAGLKVTSGEFVCLLDPDDRYAPEFLAEMVRAHLNEVIYCPIACCDQRLLAGESLLTGCYSHHQRQFVLKGGTTDIPPDPAARLLHIPAAVSGWHWSSTSAMMFRRAALRYLRPNKRLGYRGSADSYLANGAHMLGGTLFLTRPLVYRSLHPDNAYLTQHVFASAQNKRKSYGEERTLECIADVAAAIEANGGGAHLVRQTPLKRKGPLRRLWRSIGKRWRRARHVR